MSQHTFALKKCWLGLYELVAKDLKKNISYYGQKIRAIVNSCVWKDNNFIPDHRAVLILVGKYQNVYDHNFAKETFSIVG